MQDARGWLEVFVEGLKCLLNILLKSVDSSSSRFAIILHPASCILHPASVCRMRCAYPTYNYPINNYSTWDYWGLDNYD